MTQISKINGFDQSMIHDALEVPAKWGFQAIWACRWVSDAIKTITSDAYRQADIAWNPYFQAISAWNPYFQEISACRWVSEDFKRGRGDVARDRHSVRSYRNFYLPLHHPGPSPLPFKHSFNKPDDIGALTIKRKTLPRYKPCLNLFPAIYYILGCPIYLRTKRFGLPAGISVNSQCQANDQCGTARNFKRMLSRTKSIATISFLNESPAYKSTREFSVDICMVRRTPGWYEDSAMGRLCP